MSLVEAGHHGAARMKRAGRRPSRVPGITLLTQVLFDGQDYLARNILERAILRYYWLFHHTTIFSSILGARKSPSLTFGFTGGLAPVLAASILWMACSSCSPVTPT